MQMKLFDQSTLISILNSLVFSKMFYCSSVRSKSTQKNIVKLQIVQNFAARFSHRDKKIRPHYARITEIAVAFGDQAAGT